MNKLELGTQLVEFINVNMYESLLAPESVLEQEFEEEGENDDNFDNKIYTDFIADCATEVFNNKYLPYLKNLDIGIVGGEVAHLYSPKSYNYGGDELYFDLNVEGTIKELWEKYSEDLDIGEFEKYINKRYKSHDGFSSLMPNTMDSFEKILEGGDKDSERVLAVVLNFDLETNDDIEEYQEILAEIVVEKAPSYDFFPKSKEVKESFVKDFKSWKKL